MMKIIDPHLHLFDLQKGKYGWLQPENPPYWSDKAIIHRNFSESDLALTSPIELAGFVHIEAGFNNDVPLREVEWLESTCKRPFKAIAGTDLSLSSEAFIEQIAKLKTYQSVIGVRHILDEDAVALLKNPVVKANLAHLEKVGMIFEAQFDVNDDDAVAAFLDTFVELPSLNIVLNHAGFPTLAQGNQWLNNIGKLARLNNLSVKASGWEMMHRDYPVKEVESTVKALVDTFGVERVMLASNFPLTLFRTSYAELWQNYFTMPFTENSLTKLLYQNALHFYRF